MSICGARSQKSDIFGCCWQCSQVPSQRWSRSTDIYTNTFMYWCLGNYKVPCRDMKNSRSRTFKSCAFYNMEVIGSMILFYFIEFIGVTLVHGTIQVFHRTSSAHRIIYPSAQAKSLSPFSPTWPTSPHPHPLPPDTPSPRAVAMLLSVSV